MRDNDILIRQIIFDLEIDSEDAFQSYAEVLNNFTRNNILKILSEIENEEAFSDIDIHIDSLSIDLDLIDILPVLRYLAISNRYNCGIHRTMN